jgi:hypothetical protein
MWRMSQSTFRRVIAHQSYTTLHAAQQAIARVPLLKSLSLQQLGVLSAAMTVQSFAPGTRIISKGSAGNTFYIIKVGCRGGGGLRARSPSNACFCGPI